VKVRRQTRALESWRRCGWTWKNASGMTSTRWRAAAHRATGLRAHGWRGENAHYALPRRSGVLTRVSASIGRRHERLVSQNLGARRGGRSDTARQMAPKSLSNGERFLGERAGGPNAAHPVTQTVSNPYLRRRLGDGKLVSSRKVTGGRGLCLTVKFRLTNHLLME
jgi:hypothetical protein